MPRKTVLNNDSKIRKDYSPSLPSIEPFWLDFWCNNKSRQEEILAWIQKGGEPLKDFFLNERILSNMFGQGHA